MKKKVCSGIFARALMNSAKRAARFAYRCPTTPRVVLEQAHQGTTNLQVHAAAQLFCVALVSSVSGFWVL